MDICIPVQLECEHDDIKLTQDSVGQTEYFIGLCIESICVCEYRYNNSQRGLAQYAERLAWGQEAGGANPPSPTSLGSDNP